MACSSPQETFKEKDTTFNHFKCFTGGPCYGFSKNI